MYLQKQDDLIKNKDEESKPSSSEEENDSDRKRSRTRSRTYSIDVVNHPELEPVIEKKKFTIKQCYLMAPASFCDMCGTSLMYVALTLTSAASFQMIRGKSHLDWNMFQFLSGNLNLLNCLPRFMKLMFNYFPIFSTGAVIIFTGINSMIFLKAKLAWYQWTGMFVVLCGLIIVGLPDFLYPAVHVNSF